MSGPPRWLVRLAWSTAITLAIIGAAAAIQRTLVLTGVLTLEGYVKPLYNVVIQFRPAGAAPINLLDVEGPYAQHAALMLSHAIPGLLFMILGPLQFLPGLRARHIRLHRWSGRVFLAASAIALVSGMTAGWRMPVGGASETAAVTFFGTIWAFELARAFWHVRRGEIAEHRVWMMRAFMLGLGVATDRPVVTAFFAFSRMPLPEFFAIALWLSFSLNLVAGEIWVNYSRRGQLAEQSF